MNINATLLVQAGNFYIAYLLFRYILLEPGYQVLQEKWAHQAALEDAIVQETQSIEKERERQRKAWQEFRVWTSEYRPARVDTVLLFKGLVTSYAPPKVTAAEKEKIRAQLIDSMKDAIRERYE